LPIRGELENKRTYYDLKDMPVSIQIREISAQIHNIDQVTLARVAESQRTTRDTKDTPAFAWASTSAQGTVDRSADRTAGEGHEGPKRD
jgi:hypothetical protein